jgi:hypothetical protein
MVVVDLRKNMKVSQTALIRKIQQTRIGERRHKNQIMQNPTHEKNNKTRLLITKMSLAIAMGAVAARRSQVLGR